MPREQVRRAVTTDVHPEGGGAGLGPDGEAQLLEDGEAAGLGGVEVEEHRRDPVPVVLVESAW